MRPNTLRLLRRYHQYLGVFFAPFILLFAVSGALQTFRLQEEKGYGGTPPSWIVWLASVHKDQAPPRERKAPKLAAGAMAAEDHHHDEGNRPHSGAKRPSPVPLKVFVALLSLALAVSTIMGVVIALANRGTRRSTLVLLALGAVVPSVLLWV